MNDAFRFDGRNLDAGFWDRLLASSPQQIHDFLTSADSLPAPEHRKVKTIAIFYHRYCCGGIERVLSEQFAYFLNLGYKVVFLTEEQPSDSDFSLPPQVVRLRIPSQDPMTRLNALREIFERHGVDLYYTHASFARQTLWDLLIVRFALNRRVVVHAHGIFPCSLVWGENDLQHRLDLYGLADKVVVLTRADAFYYRAFGVNCSYIPNPLPEIARQDVSADGRFASRTVLSVGRICSVKQTLDVLRIAHVLQREDPSIRFLIVGSREDFNYWNRVQSLYRECGLGATVDFMDYTTEIADVYRKGSALLVTSQLEGFPMVMAEALGCGLPVISYEMPYVEFMRMPDSGILTVPPGDIDCFARRILDLFSDRERYRRLIENARTAYERMVSDSALERKYAALVGELSGDRMAETSDDAGVTDDARCAFQALLQQLPVFTRVTYERGWRGGAESVKDAGTWKCRLSGVKDLLHFARKAVWTLRNKGWGEFRTKVCKRLRVLKNRLTGGK